MSTSTPSNPRPRCTRWRIQGLLGAVVLLGSLIWSGSSAQAQPRDLEAQLQLNARAAEAVSRNDFEQAIQLLRASLELGELNVTWLNLGRTYARDGQCTRARGAYAQVASAPAVEQPPPAEITELAARYDAELDVTCFAKMTITCATEDLELAVEPGAPFVACVPETYTRDPGPNVLRVRRGSQISELRVELEAGANERVRVELTEPVGTLDPVRDPLPVDPDPSALTRGLRIAGWATAGTGVAVLIGAGVVETAVLGPRIEDYETLGSQGDDRAAFDAKRDDIETLQGLNLGLWIGGGVLAAAGTTMLLLGYLDAFETPPSAAGQPTVSVGARGAQIEWQWRW